MSSKFEPQALCAGMRVGVEFLSQLSKALEKNGADIHMIRFMTLPQNAGKFEEWVKFGIKQLYPVPRSLIEEMVAEYLRNDPDEDSESLIEYMESDQTYWWDKIDLEATFGIPTVCIEEPLPHTIRGQILGVPLGKPHIVQYASEPHVVVHIYYEGNATPRGGRPLPGMVYKDEPSSLTLAPAKYFDLEH